MNISFFIYSLFKDSEVLEVVVSEAAEVDLVVVVAVSVVVVEAVVVSVETDTKSRFLSNQLV